MLTLYVDAFFTSPYAMSSFVALEEKGVPYTVVEVALHRKEHHTSRYQARSHRVPALSDGDFWLAESSAIDEYLEDTLPPPKYARLYPADPKQRAVAREIQAWMRSDLMPIREERPTSTIFYPDRRATKPLSPACTAAVERLVAGVSPLIGAGRTTLFDQWCIADTDLTLMLQRLALNRDPLPEPLVSYATANWRRPSVKKWVERPRSPYAPY